MFDVALPTETALAAETASGESQQPAGEFPTSNQQLCEALCNEITTLAGHLNAANYRFLKLLDEFDQHEGWAGDGIRSLAHWLNFKCGLGHLVAREKVRVARALRELPLIDAAFERGEISYSKVRAMTRVATPENEVELLNIARHGTAAHMERLVRAYRRCREQVAASPCELAIRREERFYCYAEDDETMVFGGRVSVEQGRLLIKALDAMVAELDDDAATEDRMETTGQGAANEPGTLGNVSAETIDPGANENVSAETSGGEPDAKRPAPIRTRRATALVHIAEHYLATGGSGARPLTSSEAYQVFIHVNANDASPDNRINGAHTIYTDDRRCLAPHVVRQLACDAARRTVLENDRGEVLNIGRRSRTVPRHIAHALRIRDGGCRFPGCGQRRWTDAHHIRHWADGGATSLDNLVTLCRYHHRSLHREEYRIERETRGDGGEWVFIDARGRPMPPAIHPQFASGPSAADRVERLRAEHGERGVEIDETTAVTAWQGESMDYSTAVEWLQRRDGMAI